MIGNIDFIIIPQTENSLLPVYIFSTIPTSIYFLLCVFVEINNSDVAFKMPDNKVVGNSLVIVPVYHEVHRFRGVGNSDTSFDGIVYSKTVFSYADCSTPTNFPKILQTLMTGT